jgi:hypothetical protein
MYLPISKKPNKTDRSRGKRQKAKEKAKNRNRRKQINPNLK